MNAPLLIAGVLRVRIAFGHAAIRLIWVLPHPAEERLPQTPCGPASLTLVMLRVTWYIATILVVAVALLLLSVASDADVSSNTLLLQVLAAMWLPYMFVVSSADARLLDIVRSLTSYRA